LKGKSVDVTIDRVEQATVAIGTKKAKKPLIYLKGKEQPIVAGVTILKTIEGMHGKYPARWPGKRITIYGAMTTNGEGPCECVRVRPTEPPDETATKTPALSDDAAKEQDRLDAAKKDAPNEPA
jgi:hypothetical protein